MLLWPLTCILIRLSFAGDWEADNSGLRCENTANRVGVCFCWCFWLWEHFAKVMAGSMLQGYQLRSGSFTSARPVPSQARLAVARQGRFLCTQVRADNVLIANTKGGGHAFIGLHLAKQLLDNGHSVTILNDGDEVRSFEAQQQQAHNRQLEPGHAEATSFVYKP